MKGLNIQSLLDHRNATGGFRGYTGAKVIDKNPQELLEYECEILIPAALERQINMNNAHNIKAKLIGEGILSV